MKTVTRVTITDDAGDKFFGEGPDRLLRAVEREGSLLRAAKSMEMAYSKALRLIENAEKALGYPLLLRTTGGKSGGGSVMTAEGKAFAARYEAYRDACRAENRRLFRSFFPEAADNGISDAGIVAPYAAGCVIMASGLSQRFGRNKLLEPFRGGKVIDGCLAASENGFRARVAVTRDADTAAYLKDRGLPVVLHALPGRNDTVRLGLTEVMEAGIDGCMFFQADQPLLRRETVEKLLRAAGENPDCIIRPSAAGAPGAPVLFPRVLFPALLSLPEGKGGGVLIGKYPGLVREVEIGDPAELRDIDTEADLVAMEYPEKP